MTQSDVSAIIATGGKQERIKVGQRYKFESLQGEPGDTIEFDKVLMVMNGDKISVGAPYLDNVKVQAKILQHGRGKKIKIIKMRRRKTYRRQQGHRQNFTEVQITSI
jgi:large subunit ribosomal protein L21